MFAVPCPVIGAEVHLGPRNILSRHKTSRGVVGYFRCRCGTVAVFHTARDVGTTTYHHPGGREPEADQRRPAPDLRCA